MGLPSVLSSQDDSRKILGQAVRQVWGVRDEDLPGGAMSELAATAYN